MHGTPQHRSVREESLVFRVGLWIRCRRPVTAVDSGDQMQTQNLSFISTVGLRRAEKWTAMRKKFREAGRLSRPFSGLCHSRPFSGLCQNKMFSLEELKKSFKLKVLLASDLVLNRAIPSVAEEHVPVGEAFQDSRCLCRTTPNARQVDEPPKGPKD